MRPLRMALLLIVAAICVVGCNGNSSESSTRALTTREAQSASDAFIEAVFEGRWDAAGAYVSEESKLGEAGLPILRDTLDSIQAVRTSRRPKIADGHLEYPIHGRKGNTEIDGVVMVWIIRDETGYRVDDYRYVARQLTASSSSA